MAATLTNSGATGTLAKDKSNESLQSPRYLKFEDATPLTSPQSIAGGIAAPQAFVPPANSIAMVCRGDVAFGYGYTSVLDGSSGKGYKKASSGVDVRIPCINGASIYIGALSGALSLDFHFEMI